MNPTPDTAYAKQKIVNYIMSFACGHRNAKPRSIITEALGMDDRSFRDLCSDIPEIIGSVRTGYWILPLVDYTGEEIRAARAVVDGEERRRMIALYLRQRRQRQAIRRLQDKQGQLQFAGV